MCSRALATVYMFMIFKSSLLCYPVSLLEQRANKLFQCLYKHNYRIENSSQPWPSATFQLKLIPTKLMTVPETTEKSSALIQNTYFYHCIHKIRDIEWSNNLQITKHLLKYLAICYVTFLRLLATI